jgi:hypothetical protein
MGKSLKDKNRSQLIVFALLNAIGLGILLDGLAQALSLVDSLTKGYLGVLSKLLAVPAVLALIIGILGWAIPKMVKETMIFWRIHNCLPSSWAFSAIALGDPRIDRRRLTDRYGELPSHPSEQTALWYRLYKRNAEDPAVEDAHCAYLRYREMVALTASVMICFLIAAAWVHPSIRSLIVGALVIVAEYLVLVLAARNAATHFVANVLAIESAADREPA